MSTHFAHHPVSVGLLLFPTVEELDFAGPYEVFANAGEERGASVLSSDDHWHSTGNSLSWWAARALRSSLTGHRVCCRPLR